MASGIARAQQPFDLDPSFRAEFDDWYVSSILPQPDGKVIISGQFTFPGGEPLEFTGIGRLNADGSWDPSFEHSQLGRGKMTPWDDRFYIASTQAVRRVFLDGTNDNAYHLGTVQIPYFLSLQGGDYHVYPDGRILMSGAHQVDYPDSNWVGIYNFIWFTSEGYLDTTRVPRMGDGTIDYFKELPDGKFMCTGAMSQYEGQPTTSIFRVQANGQLDPSFNANVTWGRAFGFLPLADGRCYASGLFIQNNSADTLQLVRFMPDGSLDPSFNNHRRFGITEPFFNFLDLGSVDRIHSLDAGRLVITGSFRDVDGEARGSICLVDTVGNLLDDYFVGAACGPHDYMGVIPVAIAGIHIGDSACYIWGDYHGYNDGTTNDPLQRFVTRLYGPDIGMGVPERTQVHAATLSIAPNPALNWVSFTYTVADEQQAGALEVRDVTGRLAHRAIASGKEGQLIWDCRKAGAGAYNVALLSPEGRALVVERLLVNP